MGGRLDRIEAGRRALAAHDWTAARDAFESALDDEESPDALDGLGRVLWWQGSVREAFELRTAAYAALRRAGRVGEAGALAVWLAREHRTLYGDAAVTDGWLARAESAAQQADAPGLRGWVWLARAESSPDATSAVAFATHAVEIGRSDGDLDLEIVSLARLGVLEIATGEVDRGTTRLDRIDGCGNRG